MIAEMSPCPQLLWIRWMFKTGASGRRYRKITWTVGVVEFGDSGRCVRRQNQAWASNQWKQKRGIATGHVTVVDYVSSRISAKVSCSLALPSPDSSVSANSLRLLFCSTQVSSPKIKNIILYFYICTCYSLLITIQYTIQHWAFAKVFLSFTLLTQ